jgi:hypothetical protein
VKDTTIFCAIGNIDDKFIIRAGNKAIKKHKSLKSLIKFAVPAVACLILAVMIAVPLFNNNSNFDLILSSGVTVKYVINPPNIKTSALLAYLTEEELFAPVSHGFEMVIFEGKVVKVDNIVISFQEQHKDYRAIVHVKVSEVYRGNIEPGTTVSILLPAPVGKTNFWVSDTTISSQMNVGTTGIFMPARYEESTVWEQNNKTLYLQELAEYGFLDGERWAFIETPSGLQFSRHAYESITDATTLDEVRQYVITMLEQAK